MPNICRLGPDGKYAGNINQKYFVLANILYIPVACTVKSLYSEQSRDPKKCSLYGGVHPKGVRYVHAYMCLKYNVHILKLTCQISLTFESLITIVLTFPASSSSFVFCLTCLQKQTRCAHYDCNLQTDWNLSTAVMIGRQAKHYHQPGTVLS